MRFCRYPIWIITVSLLLTTVVYAHPGRTDSNGGHTNHSTGEYHYHHGYDDHQHYDMDGDGDIDCPYNFDYKTGKNSGDSSKIDDISELSSAPSQQKHSTSTDIGTKIALSVFVLFPVGFFPAGLFLWVVSYALSFFKIELSEKWSSILYYFIYFAICSFLIYLIFTVQ